MDISAESSYIQLDSARIFQDYARNLAREGKFGEALSIYSVSARQSGQANQDIISDVGQLMIEHYRRRLPKLLSCMVTDAWSCCACAGVLVEPITLWCGHSSCKKCIMKDLSERCKKCGVNFGVNDPDQNKSCIVVGGLVRKFWAKELRAVELRNEGNKLFQREELELSVQKYTEAFSLAENDHLLTSNRSHAYYKLGDYSAALVDAELTVQNRPDWGKGYFRKGMSLKASGDHSGALVAFFECLVFEEHVSKPLKAEILGALFRVVCDEAAGTEPDLNLALQLASYTSRQELGSCERGKAEGDTSEADGQVAKDTEDGSDNKLLIPRNQKICSILEDIGTRVAELSNLNLKPSSRHIEAEDVEINDFECALCFRLLWQPVTTCCGHTYCKSCLDRSLDHRSECPLCKAELDPITRRLGVNDFVDQTIRRMLPSEFLDRQRAYEEEIVELAGGTRTDGRMEVPIFICTMSFPKVPCPLHVFEPRYRLMIRRAMESGTREFGMCIGDANKGFADYGTMLEIRDIQYFTDGRSVVDTLGSRRFRVVERGTKDGYSTAVIENLSDEVPHGENLEEVKTMHDRTRSLSVGWFNSMEASVKVNVTSHYGTMPRVENEYWKSSSGPAWAWWVLAILPLDTLAQQQILSQVHLKRRLEAIGRILGYMKRRGGVPL